MRLAVIAEDDDLLRDVLSEVLQGDGWRVLTLEDGFELFDYLILAKSRSQPDLVVADVLMPGMSGLDVIERAREQGLACPVIVMSGHLDEKMYERCEALKNVQLLAKRAELNEVVNAVRALSRAAPVSVRTPST